MGQIHWQKSFQIVILSGLALSAIGCKDNQTAATSQSAQMQNLASDPAAANLAPLSDGSPANSPYTAPPPAQQPSRQQPVQTARQASPAPRSYPTSTTYYPAEPDSQNTDASYPAYTSANYSSDYQSYDRVLEAQQPPPPLPVYQQPPCPGDNYIWTPGTWSYATTGYYWVPGTWVTAPFVGALWTPPYWGYEGSRYRLHHGFWGNHIGFYGGVSYGFGYTGHGYYGGYWDRDRFRYNRAVTNVNVNNVHNVYNYTEGRTVINNTRISYAGGRGGIEARPLPAELAAARETRVAPVPEQLRHIRDAQNNRAQFASENQGRPQMTASPQPLATAYRAPAPQAAAFAAEHRVPIQPAAVPNQIAQRPAFGRPNPQPIPQAPVTAPAQQANRPDAGQTAPAAQQRNFGRPEPMPAIQAQRPVNQPSQPAAQPRNFGRPEPAPAVQATHPNPVQTAPPPARQPEQQPRNFERPQPAPAMQAVHPRSPQAVPEPAPRPAQPRTFGRPEPVPNVQVTRPVPQPLNRPAAPAPAAVPALVQPQVQRPVQPRNFGRPEPAPTPRVERPVPVQAAPAARPPAMHEQEPRQQEQRQQARPQPAHRPEVPHEARPAAPPAHEGHPAKPDHR